MKIPFKHLSDKIDSKVSIKELSENLFQLGHEHEIIENNIFDFEFTPNRGDCLSTRGLLRDLSLFYEISLDQEIYKEEIADMSISFINNAREYCKNISFLKIEIDDVPDKYNGALENYFVDLNNKKINFFTDVSNFISYETGQPTHCYDSSKVPNQIKLDFIKHDYKFETLLEKTIELKGENLVFLDEDDNVINFAGIVGGSNTSCNNETRTVIVECAHFDSEVISGKSIKYGINSEAAHKFERNCDPDCHEYVLRRFIKIIDEHTKIKNLEIFSENINLNDQSKILFDIDKINNILGTNIDAKSCLNYLKKLGFDLDNDALIVPSFRNDVKTINDISEEIARSIGYDVIENKSFDISFNNKSKNVSKETNIKNFLTNNGFHEVINDPFVSTEKINSVKVDNPLDSNRNFLRIDLKDSLVKNLLYNERRQQDSVKLFEISNIYSSELDLSRRVIGIIASGRIDKNYNDFSKFINNVFLKSILSEIIEEKHIEFIEISRDKLDTKLKNHICYVEIETNKFSDINFSAKQSKKPNISYKYEPISDYPSSTRDLSFSIKDFSKFPVLENDMLNFKHKLLKSIFIFDYYNNQKMHEIKVGFRFIFQSNTGTITDKEVNNVMTVIMNKALELEGVTIPGIN